MVASVTCQGQHNLEHVVYSYFHLNATLFKGGCGCYMKGPFLGHSNNFPSNHKHAKEAMVMPALSTACLLNLIQLRDSLVPATKSVYEPPTSDLEPS